MYNNSVVSLGFNTNLNNLTNPLSVGGVYQVNKNSQKANNNQIRELVRELQKEPNKDKVQEVYTLILSSLLMQNNAILKDTFKRYKSSQFKKSNPKLTKYEIDLIEDKLYKAYRIRQDYTNERLKDLVKKDYTAQLALLGGLILGSRDKQRTIKESVKSLQNKADNMLDDDMHRLRSELNFITAKEYGAFGYIWKNQQDNRVVGNPLGIYPVVKNPLVHGNHWVRENKLYLYDFATKQIKKDLKNKGIEFELDKDLLDGSAGEPYGCRCYKVNVYNLNDLRKI